MLNIIVFLSSEKKSVNFRNTWLRNIFSSISEEDVSNYIANIVFDIIPDGKHIRFCQFAIENCDLEKDEIEYYRSIGFIIGEKDIPKAVKKLCEFRNKYIYKNNWYFYKND